MFASLFTSCRAKCTLNSKSTHAWLNCHAYLRHYHRKRTPYVKLRLLDKVFQQPWRIKNIISRYLNVFCFSNLTVARKKRKVYCRSLVLNTKATKQVGNFIFVFIVEHQVIKIFKVHLLSIMLSFFHRCSSELQRDRYWRGNKLWFRGRNIWTDVKIQWWGRIAWCGTVNIQLHKCLVLDVFMVRFITVRVV